MNAGADAILDVRAPSVRATAQPTSSASDDQPSFDDHLSDAVGDLHDTETPAEQPSLRTAPEAESKPDAPQTEPQSVSAAPQSQPAPAAALLQIYASLAGETAIEQQPTAPAPLAAPVAASVPTQSAPTALVQPKPAAPKAVSAPVTEAMGEAPAEPAIAQVGEPLPAPAAPVQDAAAPQATQAAVNLPAPTPETATVAMPVAMPVAPPSQSIKSDAKSELTIDAEKPTAGKTTPVAEGKAPPPALAPRPDGAAQQPVQAQGAQKSNAGVAKSATAEPTTAGAAPAPAQPSTQSAPLPPAVAPVTEIATAEGAHRAMPAAHQIGREIIRRFNGESTRFELRLDPPELGRVDVRLEVSRDHKVTAIIAADNPQALAELSRHARDLEQALNSAGLDLAEDGLSFDLSNHRDADARGEEAKNGAGANSADAAPEPIVTARPLGLERWRGIRVDVMA